MLQQKRCLLSARPTTHPPTEPAHLSRPGLLEDLVTPFCYPLPPCPVRMLCYLPSLLPHHIAFIHLHASFRGVPFVACQSPLPLLWIAHSKVGGIQTLTVLPATTAVVARPNLFQHCCSHLPGTCLLLRATIFGCNPQIRPLPAVQLQVVLVVNGEGRRGENAAGRCRLDMRSPLRRALVCLAAWPCCKGRCTPPLAGEYQPARWCGLLA